MNVPVLHASKFLPGCGIASVDSFPVFVVAVGVQTIVDIGPDECLNILALDACE